MILSSVFYCLNWNVISLFFVHFFIQLISPILSYCVFFAVMDGRPVQGVLLLSPNDSWDGFQLPPPTTSQHIEAHCLHATSPNWEHFDHNLLLALLVVLVPREPAITLNVPIVLKSMLYLSDP